MAATTTAQASLRIWEEMAAGWEGERGTRLGRHRVRSASGWWTPSTRSPGRRSSSSRPGSGDTGFAAARRLGAEGRLITTDFSDQMVEAARRRADELGVSNAEFRTLDAERMDLDDGSVDGVLCRWGYMLMADPAAALARRGACSARAAGWPSRSGATRTRNPWASIPARALLEQTGARATRPVRARDLRHGERGAHARAA